MITDRTYHRLLHVDWIRADVDGDGLPENIASSDQAARQEPQRSYDLFSSAALDAAVKKPSQERYFFGGAVYNGWSSVPDRYKVDHLDRPDATHPTARIFTFSWKSSLPRPVPRGQITTSLAPACRPIPIRGSRPMAARRRAREFAWQFVPR